MISRKNSRTGGINSSSIISSGLFLSRTLRKIAASTTTPKKVVVEKPSNRKTLLTDDQVRDARRRHEIHGEPAESIAESFGLSMTYTQRLLDYTTRSKVLI